MPRARLGVVWFATYAGQIRATNSVILKSTRFPRPPFPEAAPKHTFER